MLQNWAQDGWLSNLETLHCSFARAHHTPWASSTLRRTPGCAEYHGQMAGFLTFISLTLQCVLFFFPFEMWLILEAAESVQIVLLRIHPWEFHCKAREKSDPWEEAKHRFQRNSILMLEQVFPLLMKLVKFPSYSLLSRQVGTERNNRLILISVETFPFSQNSAFGVSPFLTSEESLTFNLPTLC